MNKKITDTVKYVGVEDTTIDLFEGQYPVPDGVSYNSYLILDEKTAVMDSVDKRAAIPWLDNLNKALGGREPDYLVIQHLEPDHSGSIKSFIKEYPNAKLVTNAKAAAMLPQFFDMEISGKCIVVSEGEELSLGSHVLTFLMAPMVHWPEVMVTYEKTEKTLFSADAFGTFGVSGADGDWAREARRYFINIVGKYGAPVQALLKKASGLAIRRICPLHGPVLTEELGYYIGKYDTWSRYEPEEKGVVIAYASIYGNTGEAARRLASLLEEKGKGQGVSSSCPSEKTVLFDLARADMAEAVAAAFCYDRLVLACATYDAGLFPCMESFLARLKSKNYQKRTVGLIENGSWAPTAGKQMREALSKMKELTLLEPTVTIKSTLNAQSEEQLKQLAEALLAR